MPSSKIQSILDSALAIAEPIRVHGAPPAARALILAYWAQQARSPALVLCPDDDSARELVQDIQTLGELLLGQVLPIAHLPTWDQSPYSPIAPSIRCRLQRVSALACLLGPRPPSLIISTPAAACQATLPPELFRSLSLELKPGQSFGDREALIRKLLDAGYLRVDPVEDPGTFAVRGEIIDIFPPDRDHPLRIELFDDQVERIREFDAGSQRTLPLAPDQTSLQGLWICPAREVIINPATTPALRERLKKRADDQGISRAVRDPVLHSIHEGVYPDHSDAWAGFAYAPAASLLDYLPADAPVIWNDELSTQQSWDQHLESLSANADEARTAGLILPPPDEIYLWSSGTDRSLKQRSRLYLDQVSLTDAESLSQEAEPSEPGQAPVLTSKHSVFVKTNRDLSKGSKPSIADLEPHFQLWNRQRFRVLVLASTQSQLERIRFVLEERGLPCAKQVAGELRPGLIELGVGTLSQGFRWPTEGLVLLTEEEILGTRRSQRQRKKPSSESGSAAKNWSGLQALADLSVGDAIVHIDHGIGRYQGLTRLSLSGAPSDFLQIEYANKDKLYLPVYRLNVIQKYVGSGESIALDKLGGQQFAKAKEKVRDAVKRLAIDLVQLYAERSIRPGIRFTPPDSHYREFESRFPYDETPDQLRAIEDTLSDMESGKVMDRLVCGDVGYGKTEVAMRAAFKAVSDGKQVAVLVPTTVLAHQHEQNFRSRMKDYPLTIESVSRFKAAQEQKRILEAVQSGKVDIVIGTHRLLSKDVQFKDLGLVIVDEEHRFGVEHKERLKTLKVNTHVLTLTATPIPRTLHMALSGLRDISLINTPPVDRLPIRTYVSKFDEPLIKRAIEVELSRGGQAFFVHNRVQSIYEIATRIREIVPQAKVMVAHGQMGEGELEKAMISFYKKEANVLVCTSIIESGLDLPSANTILVNRADAFGLAQLYQIRGRVGRGQQRAYAYLLLPEAGAISEDAKKRLEVIQKFVELGSGFSIASHDLEIRGGGDLLGAQQSGHIAAVGFDLYTELLEEAIRELKGKPETPEDSRREPEIKTPFPAFLGEDYVPDVHQRLSLYRRLSAAKDEQELAGLEEELSDRYGPLPVESQNLLWLIRIKQLMKQVGLDSLTVGPAKASLLPGKGSKLDPVRAIGLVSGDPASYQLLPDSRLVAKVLTGSMRDLFFSLETLFKRLAP